MRNRLAILFILGLLVGAGCIADASDSGAARESEPERLDDGAKVPFPKSCQDLATPAGARESTAVGEDSRAYDPFDLQTRNDSTDTPTDLGQVDDGNVWTEAAAGTSVAGFYPSLESGIGTVRGALFPSGDSDAYRVRVQDTAGHVLTPSVSATVTSQMRDVQLCMYYATNAANLAVTCPEGASEAHLLDPAPLVGPTHRGCCIHFASDRGLVDLTLGVDASGSDESGELLVAIAAAGDSVEECATYALHLSF